MYYEKRVVGFVDILGFKGEVEATIKKNGRPDEKRIKQIDDALCEKRRLLEPEPGWLHQITYPDDSKPSSISTQFSDSIVVSLPAENPSEVFAILEKLYWIPIQLMKMARLTCRGGVAYGYARHTDTTLFGPAINQAYRLEQNAATYPRIVIHPKVLSIITKARRQIRKNHVREIEDLLTKDGDGLYYINYFKPLPRIFEGGEWSEYQDILHEVVEDKLKTSDDPGILAKYMWMNSKMRDDKPFGT